MKRRDFLKGAGIVLAGAAIDPLTNLVFEMSSAESVENEINLENMHPKKRIEYMIKTNSFYPDLPITKKGVFKWGDVIKKKKIGLEKFYINIYRAALVTESFLEYKNLLEYAIVTSWYRGPIEDKFVSESRGYYKKGPGAHTKGIALDLKFIKNDILIPGRKIKRICYEWPGGMGLTYKGIGIHLDIGRKRRW